MTVIPSCNTTEINQRSCNESNRCFNNLRNVQEKSFYLEESRPLVLPLLAGPILTEEEPDVLEFCVDGPP